MLDVSVGRQCWTSVLDVSVGRQCWTSVLDVSFGRQCGSRPTPKETTSTDNSSADTDSTAISSLARTDNGMVSVGLNAEELVIETYKKSMKPGAQPDFCEERWATSEIASWSHLAETGNQPPAASAGAPAPG